METLAGQDASAFAASPGGEGPFLVRLPQAVDMPPYSSESVELRLTLVLRALEPESTVHCLAPRSGQKGVSIGRSDRHCDVVLDCQVVSKRHAELNRPTSRWRLKDLESANGTFVERQRLPAGVETIVQSGQVLSFTSYDCVLLGPEDLHALACMGGGATTAPQGLSAPIAPEPKPAESQKKPGGRHRARATGRLGIPTTGISFRDFARRTTRTSEAEFTTIYPGPFLLELTDGALDHPPPLEEGARARVDKARGHRLDTGFLHSARPVEGEEVLIGRVGCSVVLNTTDASRKHAKLHVTQTGWRLIDLESANGTEIEGRRLAAGVPTRVTSGMVLSFASYRCLLLCAEDLHSLVYTGVATDRTRDPEKVRQLRELIATPPEGISLRDLVDTLRRFNKKQFLAHCTAQFLMQVPTDHAMPEEPTEEGADEDAFEGTQAMSRTRIMSLQRSKKITNARVHVIFVPQGGGALLVGRSVESCDIVLDETSVSKEHAELIRDPNGWNLLDLESNNGSFVEGERVPSGVKVPLEGGASINFSSYVALWLTPVMMIRLVETIRADTKKRKT